jgi:acetoin utilization deacetylase AcuC-like enzyme
VDPRPGYIEDVRARSAADGGDAGNWTPFGRGTYDVAALAAGGCIAAADAVADGRVRNAYALVRPPGHHAGPDGGSGYCVFSNVALTALHLQRERGVGRVAIVDWDVHHGNGTQAAFWTDPSVLAISLHQDGLFPVGSGRREETGAGEGEGATINVPLPRGPGAPRTSTRSTASCARRSTASRPSSSSSPRASTRACATRSGRMNLTSECFGVLTDRVLDAAGELCDGRLVLCHEGGYSSAYVAYCGLAIVERLAGVATGVTIRTSTTTVPSPRCPLRADESAAVDAAARIASRAWPRSSSR